MRRVWTALGLAIFVAGCGIISGLDGLDVTDASDDGDASCTTCNDAATNMDVGPPTIDSGDSGPLATPGAAVSCGQDICRGVTPYCCRTSGGSLTYSYKCIASAQVCAGLIIRCDSQDDCASGQVCCFNGYADGGCVVASNVMCLDPGKCVGQTAGILCNDAGQCPSNQVCAASACSLPGYDVCK